MTDRDQLIDHVSSTIENAIRSLSEFNSGGYSAQSLIASSVQPYLKEIETLKALRSSTAGSYVSHSIDKGRGRYPKHRAVVHLSNGLESKTRVVRWKWRKAKSFLRNWVDQQKGFVYLDLLIQPIAPVTSIKVDFALV